MIPTAVSTEPIPLRPRNVPEVSIACRKPIILLIDEPSTSTHDSVPAIFQENNRGLLYGYRTKRTGWKQRRYRRRTPCSVRAIPTPASFENAGVHPEVVDDYMTRENLLGGGAPFVQRFLWAMAAYVRQQRGQ